MRIGGKLVVVGTYDTAEAAQAAIDGVVAVAAERGSATAERALGVYALEVLERRELGGKIRGIVAETSVVRSHLLPDAIALLPIDVITPRDVRLWIERLSRKPVVRVRRTRDGIVRIPQKKTLSHQTVKHALRLLRTVFARAIRDEIIETNPAMIDVREEMPSTDRIDDAWTYLSIDEIVRVTRSRRLSEPNRLLYAVAIYTGLRQGEMWGLHWEDVHEAAEKPEIVVRHSHTDATKTGKVRRVPLLPPARDAFVRLRELAGENGDLVFPSARGTVRRDDDDNGWGDRATGVKRKGERVVIQRPGHKTRAGIARDVRFHDLRHTCASHLLSGSWGHPWRLEEVQQMLGHADAGTTQRYAHLMPEALHSSAAVTRGVSRHSVPDSQLVDFTGRAMQESNLRPTASEAAALSS